MAADHDATALRFLATVWRLQAAQGHAFISLKSKEGGWSDIALPAAKAAKGNIVLPDEPGDIYFAPCIFTPKQGRTNDAALPSRILYADLDEVDPRDIPDVIRPTAAIQSSPGRYQALWLLSRPVQPKQFARLNQLLTYATEADRGGWHMSKVLRVPGTRNHKYRGRPRVKLMWFTQHAYDPQTIVQYVKDVATSAPASAPVSLAPSLPNTTAAHLRRKYHKRLKRRGRKLLTVRTVLKTEDRSARLWEIENLCLDAGMSPEETLVCVKACAYNKYRGQRREEGMLWKEIQKAVEARARRQPSVADSSDRAGGDADEGEPEPLDEDTKPAPDLRPTKLTRYLAQDVRPPSWLIQHIWGRAAHGVWAGDFKTYKSTLLMDMAVSVASGRKFLNTFEVHRTGPVLYIQEENSHGFVHDRLHRIVQSKGLGNSVEDGKRFTFGHDLPLHLLNLSGFDLTNPDYLARLDEWAKQIEPALIILDPLYRMAPGIDENSQQEMAPILNALANVSNGSDAALVLAHHYNKPNQGNATMRSGHRISGTNVFSRWWESSVYAERNGDPENYSIKFHNEHREHGSAAPQVVTVEMSADDPETYEIHLAEPEHDDTPPPQDDGLDLDSRTTRVAVATVRAGLGLAHSRDAQKVLKQKGYTLRKVKSKLYAYPPNRRSS